MTAVQPVVASDLHQKVHLLRMGFRVDDGIFGKT